MDGEQLFCELELRWLRVLQATRNPRLQACASHAARRERELRAILAKYPDAASASPSQDFHLPHLRRAQTNTKQT